MMMTNFNNALAEPKGLEGIMRQMGKTREDIEAAYAMVDPDGDAEPKAGDWEKAIRDLEHELYWCKRNQEGQRKGSHSEYFHKGTVRATEKALEIIRALSGADNQLKAGDWWLWTWLEGQISILDRMLDESTSHSEQMNIGFARKAYEDVLVRMKPVENDPRHNEEWDADLFIASEVMPHVSKVKGTIYIEDATHFIKEAVRRALSSAAPRIVGDWEGFIGTMRAERDSHLAKSDQHVRDRNMGLAMRESDAAKQYEYVITVAEKFRKEAPPFAPAPLSGIAGDSDKSDLPIANPVQISEEMVERVGRDEWLELVKRMYQEYVGRNVHPYDTLIALLRQQGAERKYISVHERLPDLGTPIFIRWGDEKASPDTSDLKDKRIADERMIDHMKKGKVGWWCERRVFIDTPPPFTQTQTEE